MRWLDGLVLIQKEVTTITTTGSAPFIIPAMLLATVRSAIGNKKNGNAIQIKPRIHILRLCSIAILFREAGTKNNATIPKKERPKGTKAAGASWMIMSMSRKDDPQVSAIPSASNHSVTPNCRLASEILRSIKFESFPPVGARAFRLVQVSSELTVVITGASGFLGRHVVEEVRKLNHSIIAICRNRSAVPVNLQLNEVACVDSNATVKEFESFFAEISGPVVVAHLAAHYSNLHSAGDIAKLVESNIYFPMRLVDALSRAKPKSTVINISTLFQHFESRDYSPLSLYGATKESFLKVLDFYAESDLLKVADITIGDTYGANDVRQKLIDLLISHVGSPDTLRLGSGRQNMSLMHITDVARGISQLVEEHQSIPSKEVWRVQMPPTENILVRDLVTEIEKISGKPMFCTFDASRDRTREIYAPIEGLKKLPGYEPLIDLETGLKSLLGQ